MPSSCYPVLPFLKSLAAGFLRMVCLPLPKKLVIQIIPFFFHKDQDGFTVPVSPEIRHSGKGWVEGYVEYMVTLVI